MFDAATVEEAAALAGTDPGVTSGEFRLEIRPIAASAALRESLRVEKEMQAELKAAGGAERKPGEPPSGLRRYVMMHAEDASRAWGAMRSSARSPRVVWRARFRDGPGGVAALDATEVEGAEAGLRGLEVGGYGLDRWMSTASLERLPEGVRR